MANAFDFTNMALLALLTYAREQYGEELSLGQLADAIESDANEHFEENEVSEQDQMLSQHSVTAMSAMLRTLDENGYSFEDFIDSIANVLPEEAMDDVESGEEEDLDEDDEEEEDLDEDEDEDDEEDLDEDEEEEDLDEDEEEEDLDEDEEEEDLDEDEDEEEDDEEDDEEEDDLDEDEEDDEDTFG